MKSPMRSRITHGGAVVMGVLIFILAGCEREPARVETPPAPETTPPAVAEQTADDRTAEIDGARMAAQRQTPETADASARQADAAAARTGAERTEGQDGQVRQSIFYPTGDRDSSTILIEKVGPAQARLGQQFNYQIRVTNLSNAVLSDVQVSEQLPAALEIESEQMTLQRGRKQRDPQQQNQQLQQQHHQAPTDPATQPADQRQQREQRNQQQAQEDPARTEGAQPAGDRQRPAEQQAQREQQQTQPEQQVEQAQQQDPQQQQQQQREQTQSAQQVDQQQRDQQQQREQQQGDQQINIARWQLGELAPGQTRTIQVTGYATQPGQIATCIGVQYRPTLCTVTEVTNPQLSVTKRGPEVADICDVIQYVYTVTNTGTGNAQNVRIEDPLPEGFQTADGKQQLVIDVGALSAGQSREFHAKVLANQTGEFSSRAVARSQEDESYSAQVTTRVVQPDLAVEVQAPEWEYVDSRIDYRVTVTNQGDAPAQNTILTLRTPQNAQFVRAPQRARQGEPRTAAERQPPADPQQQDQQRQQQQDQQQQRELQQQDRQRQQQQQQAQQQDPQRQRQQVQQQQAQQQFELGTLQPGQSRTVTVSYLGTQEGELQITAHATAHCARPDIDQIQAQAVAQTYVATIPALLLAVIDLEDPVQIGESTVYRIVVRNQGSGDDSNVQLTAELPEGCEFVGARGTTEVQAENNTLNFAPVATLPAGQTARWDVEVRATQPGDARFELQMNSDSLTRPAVASEPTRLYDPQGGPAPGQQQQQRRQQDQPEPQWQRQDRQGRQDRQDQ